MDFGFSEEQEMLRATARKFFENECTSTVVRQRMEEPAGVTDDFWTKLAEQGWLGLVYPEEYGGARLGLLHLTLPLGEEGRLRIPRPLLPPPPGGPALLETGSAQPNEHGPARAARSQRQPPPRQ